jgi:Transglycosylase SLT domain
MHTNPTTAAPGLRPTIPPNTENVLSALRRAADETGTDFGYLLTTAMRESSLNPKAQAATSSATGLFQFIEQTWLGTMKQHGSEHGLGTYADAITVGNNGRYTVADAALKQEILALRKDPTTAALMAGEMTSQVRGDMEAALGRGVSAGELYVAHFLGPKAAISMIKAAEATPKAPAADMFPQAASANRSIFYAGGQARSVSSVLASLTAKHSGVAGGDTMLASANLPARAVDAAPAANEWRGAIAEAGPVSGPAISPFSRFAEQVSVMAPIMVQLLASLDPTPDLATSLLDDEPQLRRTSGGLI